MSYFYIEDDKLKSVDLLNHYDEGIYKFRCIFFMCPILYSFYSYLLTITFSFHSTDSCWIIWSACLVRWMGQCPD